MLWKCYVAYLSRLGTTKLGSSLAICWFPSETGNSVWGASTSLCTPSKMLMGLGTLGIPWDTTVFHYYCYVHIYSYMIVGKMLKFDLFFFSDKTFVYTFMSLYVLDIICFVLYLFYLSINLSFKRRTWSCSNTFTYSHPGHECAKEGVTSCSCVFKQSHKIW